MKYQWAIATKPIMGVIKKGDMIAVQNGTVINSSEGLKSIYFVAFLREDKAGLLIGATEDEFTELPTKNIDSLVETVLENNGLRLESEEGQAYKKEIIQQYRIITRDAKHSILIQNAFGGKPD